MLQPVHKSTVKALLRRGEKFSGYIAPNKVAREHVNGGWHIGMSVEFTTVEQMEDTVQRFALYNCNPELGNRVRLWSQ